MGAEVRILFSSSRTFFFYIPYPLNESSGMLIPKVFLELRPVSLLFTVYQIFFILHSFLLFQNRVLN